MRRLLNPKRVTWASDVNLCQVRLFLSEESPSQVGVGAQDHLQAKASWTSQTSGITSDDNLPPGFEGAQASNLWRTKLAQIPLVKWELPTRFILEPNWRVVAGEESQDVEVQKQREMRVLEAIYPRPSAIPLNPSVPAENFVHNDQQTPLIPITPIEEEDGVDTSQDAVAPNANLVSQLMEAGAASSRSASNNLPVNGTTATGAAAPSLEPDVLAVAQAALGAIMANDQGNLIDRELLMKILGDPQIIGQLVRHHGGGGGTTLQSMPGVAATTQARPAASVPSMPPAMGVHNMPATALQNMSNMRPPGFGFSTPTPPPISRVDPSSAHGNRPDLGPPSIPGTSTAPFNPPPGRIGSLPNMRPPPMPDVLSTSTSSVRAPPPSTSSSAPAKDINYYKSLIQQHGGERQDAPPPPFSSRSNNHHLDSVQEQQPPINSRSRDSKPKIMKPCIYFNSSRGCRHGVNCSYLHDAPSQQRVTNLPEVQNAKRMKMDREITGT
ncbi:PREDICTED: zinc finger CCCH domain-containing protein 6 [Ipomoea nil]|uniref:zinc finger CCCH domain-containing protein 6 n=1 Tax=Ipomoea nil TaxID=35883 RepID=UPI000900AF7F|nr:PREDICTED: zinc finger CCCH domain-containing protein 6 [Ipomoea nil]